MKGLLLLFFSIYNHYSYIFLCKKYLTKGRAWLGMSPLGRHYIWFSPKNESLLNSDKNEIKGEKEESTTLQLNDNGSLVKKNRIWRGQW